MDPNKPKGFNTSDTPEGKADSSSPKALSRNNVEILKKCLDQQLSHRSLACAFTLQRHFVQMADYARTHPLQFTTQVLGATVSIAALVTVPVLGAIGFSTLGPVAGSAAAAWQASIGLVEAGGLFAFCQSIATGGAAMGTVVTAGALGAVAAVAPIVQEIGGRVADLVDLVGDGASEGVAAVGPAVQEGADRVAEVGDLVDTGVSEGAAAIEPIIQDIGEGATDVGKVVEEGTSEGVAAAAPVVQEAGERVADLGNIVKDGLSDFLD